MVWNGRRNSGIRFPDAAFGQNGGDTRKQSRPTGKEKPHQNFLLQKESRRVNRPARKDNDDTVFSAGTGTWKAEAIPKPVLLLSVRFILLPAEDYSVPGRSGRFLYPSKRN